MMRSREAPDPNPAWAYFLDFDGTLVALAGSPGGVRIDRRLRNLIEDIRKFSGGAVALITGRPLTDVDRLFPGLRLLAAGQHGIERRGALGRVYLHRAPPRQLVGARHRLQEAVGRHPGVLLEDKGLSLALHYRKAPRLGGYVHRIARQEAARLGSSYCLQSGKLVVELKPAGRDKGKAIEEFMRERPFRGRLPVFVGDDLTDEYGFIMVNRLGGHSVKVGPGVTVARWRLRDVAAVRAWLQPGRPYRKAAR